MAAILRPLPSGRNSIDESFLMEHARRLCAIGIKFAGTPGERRARDHLRRSLARLGLKNVAVEAFEYLHYAPRRASCKVIALRSERFGAEPLQYTANRRAEGPAIYLGGGTPEEFERFRRWRGRLDGRIVVATPRRSYITYELAQAAGARGFVCICDAPENLIRTGTATTTRRPGNIPGVLLPQQDGQRLLSLLSTAPGARIVVTSRGNYSTKRSWNIIGEIEGTRWPSRKILLCAHYDSQNKGCGAWDDVSGTVGLLGVVDSLRRERPRTTIQCAFFGVEEQGLCWGSTSFLERHRAELGGYAAVINFDGLSSVLCPLKVLEVSPGARRFAVRMARAAGWVPDYIGDPTPSSDHAPFAYAGLPVIWPHEGPRSPYQHTAKDVLEFLDMRRLARTAAVARRCALAIAQRGEIPGS